MVYRSVVCSGIVLGVLAGTLGVPLAAAQGPQSRPAPVGQPGGGPVAPTRPNPSGPQTQTPRPNPSRPQVQPPRPNPSRPQVQPPRPNSSRPQVQPPRPSPGGPQIQPPRPTPGGGNRPNPGGGNRPNPGGGNRPNPGGGRPPQWGRPPQHRPSYNFRPNDRDYLRRYYLRNLGYINRLNRPVFAIGGFFPYGYMSYMTPLPIGLYGHLPPPPPGYQMGYYDGYVVVYDPLTYFIANVVDLLL